MLVKVMSTVVRLASGMLGTVAIAGALSVVSPAVGLCVLFGIPAALVMWVVVVPALLMLLPAWVWVGIALFSLGFFGTALLTIKPEPELVPEPPALPPRKVVTKIRVESKSADGTKRVTDTTTTHFEPADGSPISDDSAK